MISNFATSFTTLALIASAAALPTIERRQGGQFAIAADEQLGEGSCGFPVDFTSSTPLVALGVSDFGGDFKTAQCGRQVKVSGPQGSVVATVVSHCGARCVPGTIELNKGILTTQVNSQQTQSGAVPVTWSFVDGGAPAAGSPSSASPAPAATSPAAAANPPPAGNQFAIAADEQLSEGSCGIPVDFTSSTPLVALGVQDFGGDFKTAQCGRQVKVSGPQGSVTATVVSHCGARCVPGTIELNKGILTTQVNSQQTQSGAVPVTWSFV